MCFLSLRLSASDDGMLGLPYKKLAVFMLTIHAADCLVEIVVNNYTFDGCAKEISGTRFSHK